MNKVNKCFKVVMFDWFVNNFLSVLAPYPYKLAYSKGEVTEPLTGQVFVFANLYDAKQFAGAKLYAGNPSWKIFVCECGQLTPVDKVAHIYPTEIRYYWDWEGLCTNTREAPRGTMMTPWVKLIEEVIINEQYK